MNSVNVDKLKHYSELFGLEYPEISEMATEMFEWLRIVNSHKDKSTWLSFEVTPIINRDPLSKEIFHRFNMKHEEYSLEELQEAITCYFLVKQFVEKVEASHTSKEKLMDLSFDEQTSHIIMFDAVVMGICGTDIESILEHAYSGVNYSDNYVYYQGLQFQYGYHE